MISLALLLMAAPDPVLHDVDRAFALLATPVTRRADRIRSHARARALLERATLSFEHQSLDGSDVEKAFVSDANKPWRGRPHERVLAHVVLAALDMERGRCDLALPSLKAAAFFDVKASVDDRSDAAVVHALTLRCLVDDGGSDAEIAAARAALSAALSDASVGARAADVAVVEQLVRDRRARLVLDGRGPRYVRNGRHGNDVVVREAGAADIDAGDAPIVIGLGRGAGRFSDGDVDSDNTDVGVVVWSSWQQATTVRGRPFTDVLAERARFKERTQQSGDAKVARAVRGIKSAKRPNDVVGAALVGAAGAGFFSLSALTDARADDRFVDHLPGRARLVR